MTSPSWVTVTAAQTSLVLTLVMSGAGTSLAHLTVSGAGQVILGLATCCTTIVWLTRPDSLPQASTAFQVLVRVNVPVQLPGVVTSLTSTTVGAGAQLSVAVGGVKTGVAGQSMVASGPAALIMGATSSLTVMICVQVSKLPQASVAL